MDLHISVVEDFKTANPDIEVVDWCMSGHHWVMKKQLSMPNHINHQTWRQLNMQMIRDFREEYDTFLRTFDAFLVCFATSFALIFEPYGKPIIMVNACRYDLPFCWSRDMEMIQKLNECLQRLQAENRLRAVSNNRADQLYTLHGSGIQTSLIPSLCLYTGMQYRPTRPTFLCYHGHDSLPAHRLISAKQPGFQWKDLESYRGIIHFPYEVSTMSMFEHFTAGFPLFFPSKSFWMSSVGIQSTGAYWGDNVPPERARFDNKELWIDNADPYHVFRSPNTHYFDSIPHLIHLLENFRYVDDRVERSSYVETVKAKWKYLLGPPAHLSYNRLPLLANVVMDGNYQGSGVAAQHKYPFHTPLVKGDVVFVKTDILDYFIRTHDQRTAVTLVTGVSDLSPSAEQCKQILDNPGVVRWLGCNIPVSHPKITKVLIGVGERERANGDHDTLRRLHASRLSWKDKSDDICVPYHGATHGSRTREPTLSKLPFEEYMTAIGQHKFVVCMRGNGLDTHRFSEILLMGSVPVVLTSPLDDLYSQFPCLIVESYDHVDTSTFVWDLEKYNRFLRMFWCDLHVLSV